MSIIDAIQQNMTLYVVLGIICLALIIAAIVVILITVK